MFAELVDATGLRANDRVLEVGCGPGRFAYLMSCFLSPAGRYEGLDPVKHWVSRNRRIVCARRRDFRFRHYPVRNAVYNPRGAWEAARAKFPVASGAFSMVFAASVLQHNRAEAARNLIAEIARVLRPGGRALITCFLTSERKSRGKEGNRSISFARAVEGGWTTNPGLPEVGIAFEERGFLAWCEEAGLKLRERYEGRWRGDRWSRLYQDMLVLKKARR